MGALSLFKPKLSIPDFVLQLWRKSCETKSSKAWASLCAVHDGVTTEDRERVGHAL